MKKFDVAIIGGGASGIAAAIELKLNSPDLSVAIIEKNEELGRKIRATGSGRCNITNTAAEGYDEIMQFFRKLGLMTKTLENGLVYPYSESAADVVELLTSKLYELGVEVVVNAALTELEKTDYGFAIRCGKREFAADKVVLALGGKAGPNYGTTGDGYAIARSLGHSVVTPIPVLTSIECAEWDDALGRRGVKLAGTRSRGVAKLLRNGEPVIEEAGEIQFTKYGLSGICVFNLSRYMRYSRAAGESLGQFAVKLDLYADGNIYDYLIERRNGLFSGEHVSGLLKSVLKENVADYVLQTADRRIGRKSSILDRPIATLTDADIEVIADCVHKLEFHPTAVKGWKEAQATSGGVSLEEINQDTCESLICEGLYVTGELLDYDGPCGGYNLSNAWLTGIKAGRSLA
ncbi:MAG: aminoacetone oxidase family FAD-binding enzyme [Clostridiales bacterium]|nr:aminoacetone oxidase family FAD-binding enzyme [Candidatus Crickella caballi]